MNKEGAVIIIEDDFDDQMLLKEAFAELNYCNEIIFFEDGEKALDYLTNEKRNPFFILSDINLPKLNGFDLRKKLKLDADINLKCIPYLFFTTAANHQAVIEAYSISVQGFFKKPDTYELLKEQLKVIMEYWIHCSAPNNYNPLNLI